MEQLVSQLPRAALWVVLLLLLAGVLATAAGAEAGSSPSYTLTGYAKQPSGLGPVPVGVQVDLISRATGQVYTTTVFGGGGQFNFTSASTSGALVPGYWGVWIPPQGNLTTGPSCNPCGILPQNQTPQFAFLNTSALTTVLYPTVLTNVAVKAYNSTLKGTVREGGIVVGGASVQLIDPNYDDLVLSNTTTFANGTYTLKVPLGTWILKTTVPGPTTYYNLSKVVVPSRLTAFDNVSVNGYLISGEENLASNPSVPVPTGGNVTLWDGYNGYIYSNPTPGGGFYSIGSYPGNFSTGAQYFQVVLSPIGYSTQWFPVTVSSASPSPIQQNVLFSPIAPSQRGIFATTLNFSAINVSSGKGTLAVSTAASLGNDTVLPTLPNASVGQLWAQLGLDFAHSTTFPGADLPAFWTFENQSGPFLPAVQASASINGTTFLGPSAGQKLSSLGSTCTTAMDCGLSTGGGLTLGWNETYTLNGTIASNSSKYTFAFNFAHPASADTYNYTVVLPAGYALAAGTSAPSRSQLVPAGPGKTWTKFTLVSLPSATASGSASFSIVKYANLTANVNVTVPSYFGFSSRNVLNSTHGNYTVEVGVGQNVTFSALNSTYPAGTNGTTFSWVFGDGGLKTVGQPTTNHTYLTASGSAPYAGKLTVTSSGGLVNSTEFYVWVGKGPVTAVISSNATASQNRTAAGTPYVFVNWGTVLYFNATASTAKISPTATVPGVLSVASFTITAKGYKATQNYSAALGASFQSNWSYQFLGAGVYYTSHTTINGVAISFKGWQYNMSLTVWSGSGQSASTTLVILVNDTEKPIASFQILNSAGKPISGTGVVAAANLTALVYLNGANATDPHNGSLTKYYWLVTNSGNSTVHNGINATSVKTSGNYPKLWLAPQTKAYTVNLTVTDLNGNRGYTTQSLSVSVNSTLSPIMAANNLTAPKTYNAGTSYTLWVNFTAGGGTKSTALNVSVAWYLTSPSGTTRTYLAGAPSSVEFYNYTSPGIVNTVPFAKGLIPSMAYNTTYRAVLTWTPSSTGNYVLYANATASNEYSGNYPTGPQVASQSITVNPNPTTQLLEYAAIGVAVVVVIAVIVIFYRRRTRRAAPGRSTGRAGLERGRGKESDEDDEDEA